MTKKTENKKLAADFEPQAISTETAARRNHIPMDYWESPQGMERRVDAAIRQAEADRFSDGFFSRPY